MRCLTGRFDYVLEWLTLELAKGSMVNVGEWQAIRQGLPQEQTLEIEDFSFEIPIPGNDVEKLQADIQPNLPWAEDHFLERVGGVPLNPPPSSSWWPFAQKDNSEHKTRDAFSHTYPERYWPAYAGDSAGALRGIRFPYGDLNDLVEILKDRPGSRQAFLPMWFPEDLYASRTGERVPCSLGYHFLIRNGNLKIVYYIRSCDFFRHFQDDVYMTARLAQWVAEKTSSTASRLVMHISSLHIFSSEKVLIQSRANTILTMGMK